MRHSIRFAYPFVLIIIISVVLSSCIPSRESSYVAESPSPTVEPEVLPTTKPTRPPVPIGLPSTSAKNAVAAFRDAGLSVIAQKTESLDQDWFPGTVEAVSFHVCGSCKQSTVFRFDNEEDYDYARETYNMTYHTYGNSNRVLLIIHKGTDADIANDYGAAFGSGQFH